MHQKLQSIMGILDGLSAVLGGRYEVILHDLSHVESSIVAIRGNITQREIGGPATNYLLQLLNKYGDEAPDSINYRTKLPNGRQLRSSTIFIRDENAHIIGSLCINQDLTDYLVAADLAQELIEVRTPPDEEETGEVFARDISEVMENMVGAVLQDVHKPLAYMQKEDKLELVNKMRGKGIFDVKGSVEYVAECLGVSHFTVYNYLKELRNTRH